MEHNIKLMVTKNRHKKHGIS